VPVIPDTLHDEGFVNPAAPQAWPSDPEPLAEGDNFAQSVYEQVNPGQSAPASPTPKVYIASKRQPILDESMDKVSQLGLPDRSAAPPAQTPTYISVAPQRSTNQKRKPRIGRFIFLLLIINLLVTAGAGAWIYNHLVIDLESRLADVASMAQDSPIKSDAPGDPATAPAGSEDLASLESRLENRLADVQAQLLATQNRLADAERLNKQHSQSLRDLASDVSARPGTATTGRAPATADSSPLPATSQSEMVLLKERNRLSAYADEAIATGARAPYDRLWEAIDDPRLATLVHAARAEILRVQNFYLSGSRLDAYDIPVAEYFPESAALKDTQLKDDELIALLDEGKNPWQVRMKAANLLGLRRSKKAGDALVKAIVGDQNLDVVKEASFSFEQMTGFRARLFEPATVKAWWEQYNAPGSAAPAPAAAAQ
jgi:hypothetical protein